MSFINRRVLAQMVSSHGHHEFVEVAVKVSIGNNDKIAFTDLAALEREAKRIMVEQKGDAIGPWRDPIDCFELFVGFVSTGNSALNRGRIAVLRDTPTTTVSIPDRELMKGEQE